jgi:hypothetical protein
LVFINVVKAAAAETPLDCDAATDGVYVGLGITTASENYDFNMQSYPVGAAQYMDLPYSNSSRNYTGMFSIGYKMRSPFFLAGEFSIILNRQEKNHLFHKDDTHRNPVDQNCADLHLQKGNDIQLLCKFGMTLRICFHDLESSY